VTLPPTPRRRLALARRLLAPAAALLLLVVQPLPGDQLGAVTLPTPTVSQAEASLASAQEARRLSEERVVELEAELAGYRGQLTELDDQRQLALDELAETQQRARQLVVDAYVRGVGTDELDAILDTSAASDAAWRRHLTVGRVDQAREAAVQLRDLREQVDTRASELAAGAALAEQALAEASQDVRQAVAAEGRAEEDVRVAIDNERRLAAAEAAAARQRAAEEEAARAAVDADSGEDESTKDGSDGGDAGGGSPPTPSPALLPLLNVDGWEYLRQCESGGNYRAVSADGTYRGAYQFDMGTWRGVGGTGDPAAAPPAEQDARALMLYQQRGAAPWPSCGRYLP
jgi:peptidoglycan endopeptidase LytE